MRKPSNERAAKQGHERHVVGGLRLTHNFNPTIEAVHHGHAFHIILGNVACWHVRFNSKQNPVIVEHRKMVATKSARPEEGPSTTMASYPDSNGV